MEWFFVFATWLDVSAISACIGTMICATWVLPRDAPGALKHTVWAGFGWATAMLTVASGVWLASRTLEFSGASFSGLGHFLPLVLKRTQYGLIWFWRLGAVGVLWLCWFAGRRQPRGRSVEWFAAGGLLVVVFTRSATGHAGDQGIFSPAVCVDGLHVVAGAVWVGSLFTMSLTVMPWLVNVADDQRVLVAEVFERLSTTAGAALLAILITGTLNSWEALGQIESLWHTRYGQILLAKLVLVAWMVGIGAHNRYVKLPQLARWANRTPKSAPLAARMFAPRGGSGRRAPETDAKLLHLSTRAVNTESLLAIGVLAAAALLHHAMPPTDMPHFGHESSLSHSVLGARIATNQQGLQSDLVPRYTRDCLLPMGPVKRRHQAHTSKWR